MEPAVGGGFVSTVKSGMERRCVWGAALESPKREAISLGWGWDTLPRGALSCLRKVGWGGRDEAETTVHPKRRND